MVITEFMIFSCSMFYTQFLIRKKDYTCYLGFLLFLSTQLLNLLNIVKYQMPLPQHLSTNWCKNGSEQQFTAAVWGN